MYRWMTRSKCRDIREVILGKFAKTFSWVTVYTKRTTHWVFSFQGAVENRVTKNFGKNFLEGWPSGWRRRSWKPLCREVPWVRILLPPPIKSLHDFMPKSVPLFTAVENHGRRFFSNNFFFVGWLSIWGRRFSNNCPERELGSNFTQSANIVAARV